MSRITFVDTLVKNRNSEQSHVPRAMNQAVQRFKRHFALVSHYCEEHMIMCQQNDLYETDCDQDNHN